MVNSDQLVLTASDQALQRIRPNGPLDVSEGGEIALRTEVAHHQPVTRIAHQALSQVDSAVWAFDLKRGSDIPNGCNHLARLYIVSIGGEPL